MLAGDLILAVDGVTLDGLTVDAARDRIRGPKGSVVTLTVERDGGEPFALEITRDVIEQEEVVSRTERRTGRSATSGSTASPTAARRRSRPPCASTSLPAASGSSSTCAGTPAAT